MKLLLLMRKPASFGLSGRHGILQKGRALPTGSVRVWGGKEYVKAGPGDWRLKEVRGKEAWDSSNRKAAELKISDFGTLEEVKEMAKPIRTAKDRDEAIKILKDIAQKGELTSKSGIAASLSGKSVDKIMSGQASRQSFCQKAHWQAAVNVDKLFQNAIEPWKFELDLRKNNENLKNRRYLYAPMDYEGTIVPVKFTVKEYKQQGIGKRIYSLEAIDVQIK